MGTADEFFANGMFAFRHGKYAEAVDMFTQGLIQTPNDPTLLNNRALSYRELKQFDKALKDSIAAIAADPSEALYYSTKATILTKLHRQLDALKELDTAIAIQPLEEYVVNKIVILNKLGKFQDALAGIEQVEAQGMGSEILSWYKGKILIEIKRYDEAEIILKNIVDPNLVKPCAILLEEIRKSRS